jgi:hypothetical protein
MLAQMTDQTHDFSRSLQDLEGADWGEPEANDTNMVKTVHALRRKPLHTLTDGELRLAVSQRVGEPFVVALAIERLEGNPLLDGDCYPGDILSSLIRQTRPAVWDNYPQLKTKLNLLYERAMANPEEETDSLRESLGLPKGGSRQ